MSELAFVTNIYRKILLREPDAGGVQYWSNQILLGGISRDTVTAVFLNGDEFQHVVAPVIRLYENLLGRAPDAAGLEAWVSALRTGKANLWDITQGFLKSAEADSLGIGSSADNEAFVKAMYRTMGRTDAQIEADKDGVASWVNALKDGKANRADIAQQITESPENLVSSAGFVTGYAALRSVGIDSPSTAQANAFVATASSIEILAAAKTVSDSNTLPTGPATKPVEGGVAGQTFTLTVGADDLTGTVNNDTFVAIQALVTNVATDTLNAIDQINGGAGVDTLKATISAGVNIASTSVETIQIRSVANAGVAVGVASDVKNLIETNSLAAADITFNGAKAVSSVTSGGKADLTVNGIEEAALWVKATKADSNIIALVSDDAKATALSELTVNFDGKLTVTANNDAVAPADTVTKLTVNNWGAGSFDADGKNTSDVLTFGDDDKVATAVISGKGDLTLNLTGTQAKLTSFDASALEGGVKVALDGGDSSVLVAVKGGKGNDDLSLDQLKDGATVVLGAGNDKLVITNPNGGYTVEGEDGKDDITAAFAAGKTTVINGGASNDKITVTGDYTAADTTLTVDGGAGDDFVNAGDLANAKSTINFKGGEGTDTIRITGNFGLAEANRISGFEAIDVSGNTAGAIDLSREAELKSIVVDANATNATNTNATLSNAAAGTSISVSATKADGNAGAITYSLADDTGTSDSVDASLKAIDGDNDATADGEVTFQLTANKIEVVNVASSAVVDANKADTDANEATKASDYTNQFTLVGDSVKTVNVTGDAKVRLTIADAADKLETIDATGNNGGVIVTLAQSGVTFKGGAGADEVTSTNGGAVIFGGAGGDKYTLSQPVVDVKDTIVFKAASDSQIGTKTDDAGTVTLVTTGVDTIASFGANDVIDLRAFGFSGGQANILTKTVADGVDALTDNTAEINALLLSLAKGTESATKDFFLDGTVDRGIVQIASTEVAGTSYMIIDANKDGDFNAGSDLVIGVTGNSFAQFAANDFLFA